MLGEGQAMSRRRRVLLWVGALVVLAVAGLVGVDQWAASLPGVSAHNVDKITIGMMQDDVERLLGRSADLVSPVIWEPRASVERATRWVTDAGMVDVGYDAAGRVTRKRWVQFDYLTILERLRHRLGL
jgi:hypothetical protein